VADEPQDLLQRFFHLSDANEQSGYRLYREVFPSLSIERERQCLDVLSEDHPLIESLTFRDEIDREVVQ